MASPQWRRLILPFSSTFESAVNLQANLPASNGLFFRWQGCWINPVLLFHRQSLQLFGCFFSVCTHVHAQFLRCFLSHRFILLLLRPTKWSMFDCRKTAGKPVRAKPGRGPFGASDAWSTNCIFFSRLSVAAA